MTTPHWAEEDLARYIRKREHLYTKALLLIAEAALFLVPTTTRRGKAWLKQTKNIVKLMER